MRNSYISYPNHSRIQRWCKQETSTRLRRNPDLPRKGNAYRRLWDYWGTLY